MTRVERENARLRRRLARLEPLLAAVAAEHANERHQYTRDWPQQAEANFGKLTRKPGAFAVAPPCPCAICRAVREKLASDKRAIAAGAPRLAPVHHEGRLT